MIGKRDFFRTVFCALLTVGLVLSAETDFFGLSTDSGGGNDPQNVIAGGLSGDLIQTPSHEPVAVWVFFNDRGFKSREELDRALKEREETFTSKVRLRRSKTLGRGVALQGDLPVYEEYVKGVLMKGCSLRHRSRWLNAVSVMATPEMILDTATLPFVKRIQRVARLGRVEPITPKESMGSAEAGTPGKNAGGLDYGASFGQLQQINVPAVHDSGFSGAGVTVLMIDTGFYKDHEALAGQDVIAEWDFISGDGETDNEPGDDPGQHDHGTATWSALGGFSPGNLIGPAYGASFLLAKTEDISSETPVEEDNYVAALEWADTLGVDIASASLAYLDFDPQGSGGPDYSYSDLDGNTAVISVAIDNAARRGILVCNAMGNWGPLSGSLWTPADADSMIACGAVDPSDDIAGFSSRGPTYDSRIKPEVVARGVDTYAASSGGGYGYMGGTSLSTPLVGGSAALVLEAHPQWGPMQIREALMATASRPSNPDNSYGSGLIDVWSAIYETGVDLTPAAFSLTTPSDGDTVPGFEVGFSWTESTDPQGRPVKYKLMVDSDTLFTDPVVVEDIQSTSYTLSDTLTTGTHYWKVHSYNDQGFYGLSNEVFQLTVEKPAGVGDGGADISLPRSFDLKQNYPNPFNPRTTISFEIPEVADRGTRKESSASLNVYDMRGRRVRTLFEGEIDGGRYSYSWDGRDDSKRALPSGVYIYRLTAGDWSSSRKMVLSK